MAESNTRREQLSDTLYTLEHLDVALEEREILALPAAEATPISSIEQSCSSDIPE